jgi:hypothetical protein
MSSQPEIFNRDDDEDLDDEEEEVEDHPLQMHEEERKSTATLDRVSATG